MCPSTESVRAEASYLHEAQSVGEVVSLPIYPSIIAVTGTIGSGKSSLVSGLAKRGAFVVSADDLAREVVAPGTEGLRIIAEEFGKEIILSDGTLDRRTLGKRVFNDHNEKKKLEDILFPRIKALAEERFRSAKANGALLLVYEVPLLFEAKLNTLPFRAIVVVTADDEVCTERVMKRDGLTKEEAKKRIASQLSTEIKKAGGDIVIDNSKDFSALEAQIDALFERFNQSEK